MKRKNLINIALVTLSLGSLTACNQQTEDADIEVREVARPAKIFNVTSSGFNTYRNFPGTLEASEEAKLAFRVGGQLETLPAKSGLRVKKGDLLASLDDTEYRNTFKSEEARYELSRIQYDQAKILLKKKLTSQLQFDQTAAEMKSAKAAMDQARENLDYTKLLAPFDGQIGRVNVENFEAIQPKDPIIQIQDDSQLDVHFSVSETLISQLKYAGESKHIEKVCGVVRFPTQPGKEFEACHKEHEAVADPLTRTYAAVFSLEKVDELAALPGMTVTIEIDFSPFMPEDTDTSLLLPPEAVFEKAGKKWVWLVDDEMRTRQHEVSITSFQGNMLEVTDGLSVGNKVVAAGVTNVREGMLVKPFVKERGL